MIIIIFLMKIIAHLFNYYYYIDYYYEN